jgi:hypothetical protein
MVWEETVKKRRMIRIKSISNEENIFFFTKGLPFLLIFYLSLKLIKYPYILILHHF